MSQKESQLMRIQILQDSGVVSGKAADYARFVTDALADKGYPDDALETFITHLAMAGQRTLDGVQEEGYDSMILESLKEEEGYDKAVTLRDSLLGSCQIPFSESEKEFLLVHIFNLIS